MRHALHALAAGTVRLAVDKHGTGAVCRRPSNSGLRAL